MLNLKEKVAKDAVWTLCELGVGERCRCRASAEGLCEFA